MAQNADWQPFTLPGIAADIFEKGSGLKMGKIKVTPCDIKGLYVIEPTVFKDERGYFVETYNQNDF